MIVTSKLFKINPCLILMLMLLFTLTAHATEEINFNFDQKTIEKGYTADFNDFKLAVVPNLSETPFSLRVQNLGSDGWKVPEDKNLISNLYQFNFKEEKFLKPFTLVVYFESENQSHKGLYFYNHELGKWSEILPAHVDKDKKFVRVKLKMPYAQLAILEEKPQIGQASWYSHKGCDCAASPDYEKETKLLVTNLENDKSIVVKVNDFGPDKSIHPERVIDLDIVAFKKLAWKGLGVIKVRVEKL